MQNKGQYVNDPNFKNIPGNQANSADCDAMFHKDAFILTLVFSDRIAHAL